MNWGAFIGGALGALIAFHVGYLTGRRHVREAVLREISRRNRTEEY
jgi:membrane protein DedA with SNARE-associated domain